MITEGQLMTALFERLTEQTSVPALFGEPPSVHRTPLLYLLSNQSDYERVTRTTHMAATLAPRIRIVVQWQEAPNAERQLLALIDEIVALITTEPVAYACRCEVRQILYGYITHAGTRYRMAQLALHVEQDTL